MMDSAEFTHIPVLAEQTVSILSETPRPLKRLIDCTVGCGGHSGMLLERNPELELLGIDRDDEALLRAGNRLAFAGKRAHLKKGRFSELAELAAELGWDNVDGILMDSRNAKTAISSLTASEARELLDSGLIQGGMVPKLRSCVRALENGVSKVAVLDGRIDHVMLLDAVSGQTMGTTLRRDEA